MKLASGATIEPRLASFGATFGRGRCVGVVVDGGRPALARASAAESPRFTAPDGRPSPWFGRFVDHHLGAGALEVGEAFSGELDWDAKPELSYVDVQRRCDIEDIQCGREHQRPGTR
jgi:hypothetical protein